MEERAEFTVETLSDRGVIMKFVTSIKKTGNSLEVFIKFFIKRERRFIYRGGWGTAVEGKFDSAKELLKNEALQAFFSRKSAKAGFSEWVCCYLKNIALMVETI